MFLVNGPRRSRWSGRGGGPNVIVGCVPSLNGRPQHLIEAAKLGRLDQMIFFSALPTIYGRRRRRPSEKRLKMAPSGVKLWENVFQTIPDISFFDVFGETF